MDHEVLYCSVSFVPGGKTYFYQTNDTSINAGDLVLVPVGADNHKSIVQVETVTRYSVQDAPMPVEKVKRVLGKFEASEMDHLDYTLYCPVLRMQIDREECVDDMCEIADGLVEAHRIGDLPIGNWTAAEKEVCKRCRFHVSHEHPWMRINVSFTEMEEWEREIVAEYGHSGTICIKTRKGKEYVFEYDEGVWEEGLESLYLRGHRLFYCHNNYEMTTTHDLAGVLMFLDSPCPEPGFGAPMFNYLCGRISEQELFERLKEDRAMWVNEIQGLDPSNCNREQILSTLTDYLPDISQQSMNPYVRFAEEVTELSDIESINIEIY